MSQHRKNSSPWLALALLLIASSTLHAQQEFLEPPGYLGTPQQQHSPALRKFQGIPSLAIASNGRRWATWYAGRTPGEDENNYVVLSTSADDGQTWEEVLVVDPDGKGPVRAFDPEVWIAPDGRLRWFWAQAIGHEASQGGVWCLEMDSHTAPLDHLTAPRRLTDGVMMCKPLVASSGDWLLPASTWRGTDNSARVIASSDQGKTWSLRGACQVPPEVRNFDEHMLVERQDGTLWMWVRTTYGIGESFSSDQGRSWSELQPAKVQHATARFFVRRLQSGNLLLVKHGPLGQRTGRSHLTAYLSNDDGHSWLGGLLLDERNGVSYPDGQQTEDGRIHIIYDYSRTAEQQILLASFTEADVLASHDVSGRVILRQLVSQAGVRDEPTN